MRVEHVKATTPASTLPGNSVVVTNGFVASQVGMFLKNPSGRFAAHPPPSPCHSRPRSTGTVSFSTPTSPDVNGDFSLLHTAIILTVSFVGDRNGTPHDKPFQPDGRLDATPSENDTLNEAATWLRGRCKEPAVPRTTGPDISGQGSGRGDGGLAGGLGLQLRDGVPECLRKVSGITPARPAPCRIRRRRRSTSHAWKTSSLPIRSS